MCGITLFIGNDSSSNLESNRKYLLELSKKIRHRGPDWNGIYINEENKLAIMHERLSIVGVENGSQPIIYDNKYILSVNGEIYNYKELYNSVLHNKYKPQTQSDCEVIIYLYKEFGEQCVKMLDGIFSFILYDVENNKLFIARDPIGVIPLYYGFNNNGKENSNGNSNSINNENICFSSELKVLEDFNNCNIVPPGHFMNITIYDIHNKENLFTNFNDLFQKYYMPSWDNEKYITYDENEELYQMIRQNLTDSVEKRLMSEVPFGVLLSGGLDSSLIVSITNQLMKNKTSLWGNKLHTFSIGLKDAPDLKYAKQVADYLGTIHHEYNFTVQEGIDSIEDIIYHLETYDVTTIRASTPMFLMSRKIKALGIKMVLSGEGADEILGGYLYFHNAPSNNEFHNECIRRVKNLHYFDCSRANKSTMAWGLEARVPFLDKSFLEMAIPIDPELKLKNNIEKYILRKSFDVNDENGNPIYLPESVLWRQKEQFSDGVGYNSVDGLHEFINTQATDEYFKSRIMEYQQQNQIHNSYSNIPKNKEELYYFEIFNRLFPNKQDIVSRWIPRTDWDGVNYDPSGRVQNVHSTNNNNNSKL